MKLGQQVVFVFCVLFFLGCGEYERLALEKESKHMADSLFRVQRDSLNQMAKELCEKRFDEYYNNAVDSLKETQLVKIKKLIDK